MTEEEHRLFHEWLVGEYGLRFGPEKRDILRARLEPRRAELGLDSFEQLYFRLKFHPERAAERDRVVSALTNNESYFFREPRQLELFRTEVLPELRSRLDRAGGRELRVLSAACSTGEEPYTLALLIRESYLFPATWRIRVTGFDVDRDALERARVGRFRQHSFRAVPDGTRERYFHADGNEWSIRDEIRSSVELRHVNLLDAAWPDTMPQQHAIFCRNVLIYFDDAATRRAVDNLYRVLAPGGYLFLGHAESLSKVATPLRAERRRGAMYYRKEEGGS